MTTWLEGHVKLYVSSPHYKSPPCQVWWSQTLCKRRYFGFSLSLDLTWLRNQRVTWHYGWVSLVINGSPANMVIIDLLEEEILHFQFVTWPRGQRIMWHEWVLLIINHCPFESGGHMLWGKEVIKLLIRYVISRDLEIRGSCDFMGEFPLS